MSKKILFWDTKKLAGISAALLMAVFCLIGMSFRPVYGEDEVELVMSGPRHSHWTTTESDACGNTNTSYNNKKDYGKVVVTVVGGTGGTVSASGNNSTSSTASNNSTSVTVTWNCGYEDTSNHNDLTTKHTNKITFTANKTAGYNFEGWYSDAECTDLKSSELSYSEDFVIGNDSWGTSQNTQYESTPQTWNRYAKFVEIEPVDLTFIAPGAGGSYTVTVSGSSSTVSSANVVKTGITTEVALAATPASGYMFAGWYQVDSEGNVTDLSASTPYNKTFAKSVSVGARFIAATTPKFKNITQNKEHYGLRMALASASANDLIIPVAEETVVDGSDLLPQENGLYVLPSGVKLLIPYDSSNSFQTLPKQVTTAATLAAYKKLILKEGANIEVNGAICVGGQAMAASGSGTGGHTGYTTGACGLLDMSAGGHIDVKSGGTLYCWGFIKGQDMDQGNNTVGMGTITVNSGATVWENFSVGDWRGGTATSNFGGRFFPFQNYFVQNIEIPVTYEYGSSDWCYFTLNATGGPYDTKFAIIGSSNCLFKLQNAQSRVRKWYDPTTDLVCYELGGSAILDELKIKITGLPLIGTLDIQSSDYDLPITSNMHILMTNCTMELTNPMIVQPGAVVEIKDDAAVTLKTNIFLYDKDDWGPWITGNYFRSNSNLTSHKSRGDGSSNAQLDDAKFIVDGTVTIASNGRLYTTAGGADIMGNGGGAIVFPSNLSSQSTIRWYKGATTSGDGETGNMTVKQANLHNEDESYTKAVASSTFHNVSGRWFVSGKQNINTTTHVYDEFTYISGGAVSGLDGTTTTTNAVFAPDKTGLVAGVKWCNVSQDATCASIYNATQKLHDTEAANIRYTYQNADWLQILKTETDGEYGGSDNSLYALDGCALSSLGSVDENCLYTISDVKKALVDGKFVALEKNTEDEAWHNTAKTDEYYISFAGCTWHSATKYPNEEKAYVIDEANYIWYNGDWKLVEYEDPFFFDYNEQNVKRYYEYENGAWVLAEPRVRVVDAIEERKFYFINEAFTVANGKKNTTITLLKDIPTITTALTYSAKNTTCTLDLNGHVLPGSISSMLKIDASGSTFTITDNSENKDGRIQLTVNDNARRYCVNLTSGSLILDAGIISAVNTMAYNSSSAKTTQSCGLIVKPGMTFTMNGGRIEALATYNPWGIYVEGSTTSGGIITINGGTVHAETTQISSPYGIYGYGTWNINAGATIEAVAETSSACALYVEATTSKYFGTLNLNGGTINATSTTTTATGIFVNGVYIFTKTTPNEISSTYRAVANITGGTINAITNGTTTAYGIQSRGTTTIANATVNVTPKSTTGYGLLVQDGTTTINSGTFNINATTTAKGIYANGATPDDKTGRPYNPNVIVNGGVFNVTATSTTPAYGIHMDCNPRVITSTASGYYAGVYSSVPTVTVNGGEFYVRSTTKEAWGAYVARNYRFETGTNTVAEWYRPEFTLSGGSFDVSTGTGATAEGIRTYGTTTISGSPEFTIHPATTTAIGLRVYDGTTTVGGTPTFNITAGSSTAYGALVYGDTPADKTGVPTNGNLIVNGGTFNVATTNNTTAYGVYVSAGARQITSTDAGYYPGTYSSIGHATINDGTFNVTAGTTTAYGVYVGRKVTDDYLQIFRGVADIKGGTFKVTTSANNKKANQCDGILSYGTTTISGGTFDVLCKNDATPANGAYAYGVYVLDGTTTINKNAEDATKPLFNVKAYSAVYGVLVTADAANATTGLTYNGEVIINGGTYNDTTTTGNSAYGVSVSQPAPRVIASGDYAGTHYSTAAATINDGTFNAYSAGTTAVGVFTGRSYTSANTKPNTFSNYTYGNTTINGGTYNTSATTTSVGVYTDGHAIVNGGEFNPTGRTSDAYGVYARAGNTTINNTYNPSFTVRAPATVYGALVGAQPSGDLGLPYDGELTVDGGDFDVQTTSGATAYGVFVNANKRKITSTSSGYYQGQYASAGTATINDGTFYVKAIGKTASGVNMVATVSYAASSDIYLEVSATPTCTIMGGKFKVFASSSKSAVVSTPLAENMPISGGYFNINTNLDKYKVSPKKVITLHESHVLYPDEYRYSVNEGGTVTWKNGSTTLKTEMYEQGETPVYSGDEPTKAETAEYTYTHNGWTPNIEGMSNADKTYTATFNRTENKYAVTVEAGENGSVSPASVSNIGCETASGDITATPNVGYDFAGWTLPEGVAAASGYTANSNPIRIHATASEKTITANFTARTDINYTVKHWQQNLADDEYTEVTADRQTLQGTTATATTAAAKSYTGFTAQDVEQGTIAGDGSTIVNIYYNRDKFTITWKDGSETIKTEQWKYGATPAFDYEKPATPQYTYPLTGWSPTIVAVTEDATYTAQYDAVVRNYTITFVNDNGAELQSSDVQYGVMPNYTGETPTTTKTDGIYAFAGWSPEVTEVSGATTYTAQYNKLMDLVVEEGETLNVKTTSEVTTTTIHVAGKVHVAEGKALTTDDLILEATPTTSGEITGAGMVNVTTNAYFHFSQAGGAKFKAKTWYAVAVPWQVNVPANVLGDVYIKVGEGEFVQQKLGKTFDLIYYDGERRAQGATKAWNYVEDDPAANQVMYPGRAYMIYLASDADVIRFKKNNETLIYTNVPVARYASDDGNLADWNGIANPAIYKAYLNVGATENKAQVYDPDTKQYVWFDMSENQLQVGQPIFVQSTVEGTIVANASTYSSSLAPRRANGSAETMTRYEVVLTASEGEASDRIIVRMDEDKEADKYIVGQDLAKMGVSSVVPQMWIDRYNSKMCIQTAIPTNNKATYPLSLFAPAAGEYMISIQESEFSNQNDMLYLTYDNRIIWNLTYAPYMVSLNKGTDTHYGLKIVRCEAPAVTTDIEGAVVDAHGEIRKVIIDEKVYIIRGGEIYTITGAKVQ